MFIASAKIREREGVGHLSIQLLWAIARLLVTSVSLSYRADEFHFLFLLFFPLQTYAAVSGVA